MDAAERTVLPTTATVLPTTEGAALPPEEELRRLVVLGRPVVLLPGPARRGSPSSEPASQADPADPERGPEPASR
jgi:hypothetical protein